MLLKIVGKYSLLSDSINDIYNIFTKKEGAFRVLSDISMLIGGIGALFYISYRIWKPLANGEPIVIFPLLRPFAIGICIISFPTIIGFINAILYQFIQASEIMSLAVFNDYLASLGRPSMDGIDFWKRKMTIIPSPDWKSVSWYRIDKYLAHWWQEQFRIIIEIILYLFLLFLNIYRFLGLCILYYIGPLSFCLSIFDGFQNSLSSWMMRYVNMYLWLPVGNILYSMLSVIAMVIQYKIDHLNFIPGQWRFWALVIFSIFCIFILARIPQITSWIIQAPMEESGGMIGSGASGSAQGMGAGMSKVGGSLKDKAMRKYAAAGKLLRK